MDFKEGDKVMVRNSDTDKWREAVYLDTFSGVLHTYMVVEGLARRRYEAEQPYSTSSYRQMQAIPPNSYIRHEMVLDRGMGREDWRDVVYTNEPLKKHNKLNIIYDIFTVLVGVMATIALGVIIYGIIKTT